MRRALRLRCVALASLALALTSATSACGDGDPAPRALVDGSPAPAPALELEDVGSPAYLTAVRVVENRELKPAEVANACVVGEWGDRPGGPSVHRVGTQGESVTFLAASGHAAYSCDGTGRSRGDARRWCGHAFGRLTHGSLRDPRLELGGCSTDAGQPVAFAWIEPAPRSRYVVIHERGFAEVYPTAADLPVRVSTTAGVDIDRSRAVFAVSEHGADGRALRAYELTAYVSG